MGLACQQLDDATPLLQQTWGRASCARSVCDAFAFHLALGMVSTTECCVFNREGVLPSCVLGHVVPLPRGWDGVLGSLCTRSLQHRACSGTGTKSVLELDSWTGQVGPHGSLCHMPCTPQLGASVWSNPSERPASRLSCPRGTDWGT